MSAEYVSTGLRVIPLATGTPRKRTLGLVVAAAMLLAVAELAVLRAYPAIESPPDAAALVSFGRALLGQSPSDAAFASS